MDKEKQELFKRINEAISMRKNPRTELSNFTSKKTSESIDVSLDDYHYLKAYADSDKSTITEVVSQSVKLLKEFEKNKVKSAN